MTQDRPDNRPGDEKVSGGMPKKKIITPDERLQMIFEKQAKLFGKMTEDIAGRLLARQKAMFEIAQSLHVQNLTSRDLEQKRQRGLRQYSEPDGFFITTGSYLAAAGFETLFTGGTPFHIHRMIITTNLAGFQADFALLHTDGSVSEIFTTHRSNNQATPLVHDFGKIGVPVPSKSIVRIDVNVNASLNIGWQVSGLGVGILDIT